MLENRRTSNNEIADPDELKLKQTVKRAKKQPNVSCTQNTDVTNYDTT